MCSAAANRRCCNGRYHRRNRIRFGGKLIPGFKDRLKDCALLDVLWSDRHICLQKRATWAHNRYALQNNRRQKDRQEAPTVRLASLVVSGLGCHVSIYIYITEGCSSYETNGPFVWRGGGWCLRVPGFCFLYRSRLNQATKCLIYT